MLCKACNNTIEDGIHVCPCCQAKIESRADLEAKIEKLEDLVNRACSPILLESGRIPSFTKRTLETVYNEFLALKGIMCGKCDGKKYCAECNDLMAKHEMEISRKCGDCKNLQAAAEEATGTKNIRSGIAFDVSASGALIPHGCFCGERANPIKEAPQGPLPLYISAIPSYAENFKSDEQRCKAQQQLYLRTHGYKNDQKLEIGDFVLCMIFTYEDWAVPAKHIFSIVEAKGCVADISGYDYVMVQFAYMPQGEHTPVYRTRVKKISKEEWISREPNVTNINCSLGCPEHY